MTPLDHFKKSVNEVGGQTEMGRRLGLSQARVWNFLNRDKKVPAEFVVDICCMPEVSAEPHQLRPDVFPADIKIPAA